MPWRHAVIALAFVCCLAPLGRAQESLSPQEALKLFQQALKLRDAGEYDKALPLFERVAKAAPTLWGEESANYASALQGLALVYRDMGQYAKAEPLFERALKNREAKLGPDHPDVAADLNNLAGLYRDMGQYAKAEPLFQRSLKIREAKLGAEHPNVAVTLNNLAMLYRATRQYAKAEPLFERSLKIREAKHGPEGAEVASCLNNLAILYYAMRQYSRAEPLFLRSMKIWEAKLGPEHPHVGASLNNLAMLYRDMGQHAKAEPLFLRSLNIWEAKLGPEHPTVGGSVLNLAGLHAAQERWDEAGRNAERSRRIARRHVDRVLPALAEDAQREFLTNRDRYAFHQVQSLAFERREEPALTSLSAGWVVNGKGLAHQALAERALLARDMADPATSKLARELSNVRRQLATLTLAAPRAEQAAARQAEIARLGQQEQELSRKLGQATHRVTRDDPWIKLAEVRKALTADAVLVEISRFKQYDFKATGDKPRWLGEHYAAWIIPPEGRGDVRLVDLGDAGRIEKSVQEVRKALRAAPQRIRQAGELESEKTLRQSLQGLARLVLELLLPHIADAKQWIIGADAELWLVPWAALPLADGAYAIERYQIRHVISGRDLLATSAKGSVDRPLVIADPDYDLPPAPAAELRSAGSSTELLPKASRLPGTAAEAEAIAPNLKAYAHGEPRLYTDKGAVEGVFKAARSPRLVVLSTHGFFLPEQKIQRDEGLDRDFTKEDGAGKALLTTEGKPPENPFLRCGLLLAGCNNRDKAASTDGDDGVLTGLEIVGTDLRGTELVVLSACETGLGDVRNGEGVAGLRQAFQLAGAQSVVATLWKIPDRDSALLMNDFFAELANGRGKAEALRDAQLARIKARRERSEAAHPFFWAAFTFTGQDARDK